MILGEILLYSEDILSISTSGLIFNFLKLFNELLKLLFLFIDKDCVKDKLLSLIFLIELFKGFKSI